MSAVVESVEPRADLDLRNVHGLTTFELRQELTRRGEFDRFFPEGEKARVNYDTLLHALTKLLMEDADRAACARRAELDAAAGIGGGGAAEGSGGGGGGGGDNDAPTSGGGGGESLAQRLAREKAERKAAALERSRARQQAAGYFAEKSAANEKGEREKAEKLAQRAGASGGAPHAPDGADTPAAAPAGEPGPGPEVDQLPSDHYRAY